MINIKTRGQKQVVVNRESKKSLPHVTHEKQGQNTVVVLVVIIVMIFLLSSFHFLSQQNNTQTCCMAAFFSFFLVSIFTSLLHTTCFTCVSHFTFGFTLCMDYTRCPCILLMFALSPVYNQVVYCL